MFPLGMLLNIVLTLVIAGLIFWLLRLLVGLIPDAAIQKVAQIILTVLAVIWLIYFLVSLMPGVGIHSGVPLFR